MKKVFFIMSVILFIYNVSIAQNYSWITPGKTYLKMYVADDGLYRINSADFTSAGITTGSIDPRTVKVFYKGNQMPVYFNGETDGVFDAADYFDFYGVRNYGGPTTTYDQNNNFVYSTNEYYNRYSDTSIYFIEWGGINGVRYSSPNYAALINNSNLFSTEIKHLERDYFYSQGENISATDYRFLITEKFRGEGWYWSSLSNSQSLSDTFSLPLLYTVPQTASVKIFAYPTVRNTTITNEHSLQVKINGTLITTLFANDINRIDTTLTFSSSLLSNSSVNTVSATYTFNPGATGLTSNMYIDFFKIQYPEIFKFRNNEVTVNLGGVDTTSKLISFSGYNSANPVNIYDITNNLRISDFTFNLDTLKFTGKSNGNFQIVNNAITKKPIRIKQRVVPDLVSASNGADYLIVYNKLFLSQAEQLRAYRETHDNFRSFKAEIEDLYDIFNYGIEDPIAVKNFTKHVYDNWQSPKLAYICLFGRGSQDPKKILATSVYSNNYVPVYGYPPSDGYFSNTNVGSFIYYSMIAIGRLPAYYPSEAQAMVDKIISYEAQSVGSWTKNYTYITGGGTLAEQNSHQLKSNTESASYITPPSLSGEVHKIYRSDISGSVTFNMKDSIVNDFNRGVAFVNYRGHAGSHDWEVAMTDPNTLSNGTKIPMILSLTCFTGENSKADYRGFGERYLYLSNKGAIGFFGTTGWSYQQQGNDFGNWITYSLKFDSTRRIGNIYKFANKKMSVDSISFNVRHTLNCYSLIGDPATTLKIPVRPEFSITNEDYKLSSDFPVVNEKIVLSVYPKNYGLFADSCKIRFQLKKNNIDYAFKDTVRKNIAYKDTVNYGFNIDSLGNYSIVVTLDYGNYVPLEDKTNNTIVINLPVKNTSFVPLRPVSNVLIASDSVEFVGLNPQINSVSNSVKVLVQMDTVSTYSSPLSRTFIKNNATGVTTKFKTNIPSAINNQVYFWRTNCVINNDSSGWSGSQTFIYQTPAMSKYEKGSEDSPVINSLPGISIFKTKSSQYSSVDYNNTQFSSNGINLLSYTGNLFIRSFGNNAEESSYFSVGNKNIYIDGALNGGLNLLKVKKLTGNIQEFKNLQMISSPASSDSLVNFLNTFDSTYYLMLLNASYVPGGTYLTSSAKTKLKQFGSIYCDSIGLLAYFHTWSFIGYLGATSAQATEMFDPCCRPAPACVSCDHWTESVSNKPVTFIKTSGSVNSIIGPAQTWQNFSWTQTLYPNSSLTFDVYGIDKNNLQTLLLANVVTNSNTDLSAINAYQYPKLNFVAKFNIDTVNGNISSLLNSLKVNYSAPSELVYDINSLELASSYVTGDQFKFYFTNYNSGSYDIPGFITNIYKKSVTNSNLILTDTSSNPLAVESSNKFSNKFTIPYFRDSLRIFVEYKPKGEYNETYTFNNILQFALKSDQIINPANVSVYSDGQIINGGEFVRSKPEIKVNISLPVNASHKSDSSSASIYLNNIYVPYFINNVINPALKSSFPENDNKSEKDMTMFFYPSLQKGSNKLSIVYFNNSDNPDTVSYDVIVSDELTIKNLTNYPNPMKTETNFVFDVGGSESVSDFKLKIYTVSGKLIRELQYPVNFGYNQFPWDGKDSDGDYVSNGTYLYKLVAENDSKAETKIEKLVVLR